MVMDANHGKDGPGPFSGSGFGHVVEIFKQSFQRARDALKHQIAFLDCPVKGKGQQDDQDINDKKSDQRICQIEITDDW